MSQLKRKLALILACAMILTSVEPVFAQTASSKDNMSLTANNEASNMEGEEDVNLTSSAPLNTAAVKPSDINSWDWMKNLDDHYNISMINIPGSHDTCTYNSNVPYWFWVEDQDKTIPEQLEMGIRMLDIRLNAAEGYEHENPYYWKPKDLSDIHICHHNTHLNREKKGMMDHITLEDVYEQCETFLKDNPTETIIVCTAADGSGALYDLIKEGAISTWAADYQVKAKPDKYVKFRFWDKSPTLGDVRGKIIIIPQEPGDRNVFTMTEELTNLFGGGCNKAPLKKMNAVYQCFMSTRKTYGYCNEDAYFRPRNYVRSMGMLNTPAFVSTNCYGGIPGIPKKNAKKINPWVQQELIPGHYYGWISSDFVDEDLCRKIFLTNDFNASYDHYKGQAYFWVENDEVLHISSQKRQNSVTFDIKDEYGKGKTPWDEYKRRITKIVVEMDVSPTSTAHWFEDFTALTDANLGHMKLDNVQDMSYMFAGCKNLKSAIFQSQPGYDSIWNAANAMFKDCEQLQSTNVFETKSDDDKTLYCDDMFNGCINLKTLGGLDSLKYSGGIVGNGMFRGCKKLEEVNMRGIKGGFEQCEGAFVGCVALKYVTINAVASRISDDFSKLGSKDLFVNCGDLKWVDMRGGNEDGRYQIDPSYMFTSCDSLKKVFVNPKYDWTTQTWKSDLREACHKKTIFSGCNALVGGQGTKLSDYPNKDHYLLLKSDGGEDNPGLLDGSSVLSVETKPMVLSGKRSVGDFISSVKTNDGKRYTGEYIFKVKKKGSRTWEDSIDISKDTEIEYYVQTKDDLYPRYYGEYEVKCGGNKEFNPQDIVVKGYKGPFDGEKHQLTVYVPTVSNEKVWFRKKEDTDWNRYSPTIMYPDSLSRSSKMTVEYKIEAEDYMTYYGEETLEITPAQLELDLGYSRRYINYDAGRALTAKDVVDACLVPDPCSREQVILESDRGEPNVLSTDHPIYYYYELLNDERNAVFYTFKPERLELWPKPKKYTPSTISQEFEYDGDGHRFVIDEETGNGRFTILCYDPTKESYEPFNYKDWEGFTEIGEYKIGYVLLDSLDYYIETWGETTVTINPKKFDIHAKSYEGEYDRQPHSIELSGVPAIATVSYATASKADPDSRSEYSTEVPQFTEPGEYIVYYKVTKDYYSDCSGQADVIINQRDISGYSVRLSKKWINEGEQDPEVVEVTDGLVPLQKNVEYTTATAAETGACHVEVNLTEQGEKYFYGYATSSNYYVFNGSDYADIYEDAYMYNGTKQYITVASPSDSRIKIRYAVSPDCGEDGWKESPAELEFYNLNGTLIDDRDGGSASSEGLKDIGTYVYYYRATLSEEYSEENVGKIGEINVTIQPRDLSDCDIDVKVGGNRDLSRLYNPSGYAVEYFAEDILLKRDDKKLIPKQDYMLKVYYASNSQTTYEDIKDNPEYLIDKPSSIRMPGVYYFAYEGVNNYEGSILKEFLITPLEMDTLEQRIIHPQNAYKDFDNTPLEFSISGYPDGSEIRYSIVEPTSMDDYKLESEMTPEMKKKLHPTNVADSGRIYFNISHEGYSDYSSSIRLDIWSKKMEKGMLDVRYTEPKPAGFEHLEDNERPYVEGKIWATSSSAEFMFVDNTVEPKVSEKLNDYSDHYILQEDVYTTNTERIYAAYKYTLHTDALTNYYGTASQTLYVIAEDMSEGVTAKAKEYIYDGQAHNIEVICNGSASNAKYVKYSINGSEGPYVDDPDIRNAGEYTVWYKVVKDGYRTVIGSEKLTIKKREIEEVYVESADFVYDGNSHGVKPVFEGVNSADYEITYYDDSKGTYTTDMPKYTDVLYDEDGRVDEYVYDYKIKASNSNYEVYEDKAYLVIKEASGSQIRVTVNETHTYDGNEYPTADKISISPSLPTAATISYSKLTPDDITEEELKEIPSKASDSFCYDSIPVHSGVNTDREGNVIPYRFWYRIDQKNHAHTYGVVEYTINKADISTMTLYPSDKYAYDGTVAECQVKVGGNILDWDDYELASGSNQPDQTAVGKYTLKVIGVGNYKGTASRNWEILNSSDIVHATNCLAIYDGKNHHAWADVVDGKGFTIEYFDGEHFEETTPGARKGSGSTTPIEHREMGTYVDYYIVYDSNGSEWVVETMQTSIEDRKAVEVKADDAVKLTGTQDIFTYKERFTDGTAGTPVSVGILFHREAGEARGKYLVTPYEEQMYKSNPDYLLSFETGKLTILDINKDSLKDAQVNYGDIATFSVTGYAEDIATCSFAWEVRRPGTYYWTSVGNNLPDATLSTAYYPSGTKIRCLISTKLAGGNSWYTNEAVLKYYTPGGSGGGGSTPTGGSSQVVPKAATTEIIPQADGSLTMGGDTIAIPRSMIDAKYAPLMVNKGEARWLRTEDGRYRLIMADNSIMFGGWRLVSDELSTNPKGLYSWFYFDSSGYMVVGYCFIRNAEGKLERYYFNEEAGTYYGACRLPKNTKN